MGNHRADVDLDSRPSVAPSPYPTTYVGKRRAHPVDERSVETVRTTPYVGRRRAVAATEPVKAPHVARESHPHFPRDSHPQVLHESNPHFGRESHPQVAHEGHHPHVARESHRTTDGRIDTASLKALIDLELTDTAPRPRVVAGGETRRAPTPRPPAPAHTIPVERPKPLFADDSRIDLPRLADLAIDGAIDLGSDTTTLLPAVGDGGRRRADRRQTRRSFFRRMPSLPVVIGAAALAVSAVGVVQTNDNHTVTAASGRLTGASALTGTSGTATVGSTGTDVPDRSTPLSRDSGRSAADAAAEERAQALDKLDAQAAGQDKYLHSNIWVLPVTAGVYHLTGRFGDVSGLWATVHTGLDFAAPYGTPIHAIARGVVTFVGYDGAYGNKTVVTLPDGTEIWYCHQSQFAVSVGDSVDQNEVIGYIGSTGNTTGPHVHIEVRPGGGDPVDPDPAFREHGVDPDANQ